MVTIKTKMKTASSSLGPRATNMNGQNAEERDRRLVWLFLLVLAAAAMGVLAWRLDQFALLEPVIDQAFHIQWVKRIRLADHFWPQAALGKGWIGALIADEQSVLNIYLRQVYSAQSHVFTFVTVWWFVLWSLVVGISVDAQVTISIATSVLGLCVLALMPLALRKYGTLELSVSQAMAIGAGTFLLASLSSYLNDFSATGKHNSGVLFLLLGILATARWLAAGAFDAGWRKTVVMGFVQAIAMYAVYTNVFLLPVATALAIVFSGARTVSWRVGALARYCALVVFICSPALVLLTIGFSGLIAASSAESFVDVGQKVAVSWEVMASLAGKRAGYWFAAQSGLFSAGGLALGVGGLAYMALAGKIALPLWIVACHWGWTAVLSGFGFLSKTSGYLLVLLCLGTAWAAVMAFDYLRHRRRVIGVAGFLVCVGLLAQHALTEGPRFFQLPHSIAMQGFVDRGPHYRTVVAEAEARVPAGSVLVPWDDFLAHNFWTYGTRIGVDIAMFRPLANMFGEYEKGTLSTYIETRGLALDGARAVFLWVSEPVADKFFPIAPNAVFGEDGFALRGPISIEKIGSWRLPEIARRDTAFALYQLRQGG